MKAVFWLGIMVQMQISRLRFKQSRISMLIQHVYVLGHFANFLVIYSGKAQNRPPPPKYGYIDHIPSKPIGGRHDAFTYQRHLASQQTLCVDRRLPLYHRDIDINYISQPSNYCTDLIYPKVLTSNLTFWTEKETLS